MKLRKDHRGDLSVDVEQAWARTIRTHCTKNTEHAPDLND